MTGRKQWTTFERLAAADVNSYLADQSVMRFADSSARAAAIPSPATGMISALASDGGAPSYYDGSSWVPVSVSTVTPALMATGIGTTSGVTSATLSTTGWTQVSADFGQDIIVYLVTLASASTSLAEVDLGVGAAASEQVRFTTHVKGASTGQTQQLNVPWGVHVPSGSRLAIRASAVLATTAQVHWFAAAGTEVDAGSTSFGFTRGSGAWQQVATSPPLSGGVWVVGAGGATSPGNFELGLGAASSEVVQVTCYGTDLDDTGIMFRPFEWTAGTRLAARPTSPGGSGTATMYVYWRETLDV